MSDSKRINKSSRRTFLKTAAAAASAFSIVPRHVLGGPAIRTGQTVYCKGKDIKCASPHTEGFIKAPRRPGWEI